MQMVFLDVPCEFLLRNSWPGLDYEKLKLQVHNDPTIEEYMNPQSLEERLATTRYEEVQMLRDVMEEKLWASLVQNNNRPLVQNNRPPQSESEDDDSSTS